jgi:hypothetical protein
MGMPALTPGQVREISTLVANYIRQQQRSFAPKASPLSLEVRVQMNCFFRSELVNSARAVALQNERVANPDFYPMLQRLGFRNLPDFVGMAAITFADVIVSHGPFTVLVLFHELVHVEQYRQLGIERFAELYVRGFLSGGSYEAIPLELNAYGLGGVFEKAPHRAFSVENEVAAWIREGRF